MFNNFLPPINLQAIEPLEQFVVYDVFSRTNYVLEKRCLDTKCNAIECVVTEISSFRETVVLFLTAWWQRWVGQRLRRHDNTIKCNMLHRSFRLFDLYTTIFNSKK